MEYMPYAIKPILTDVNWANNRTALYAMLRKDLRRNG